MATVEVDSGNDIENTGVVVQKLASKEEGLQVEVNTLPFLL